MDEISSQTHGTSWDQIAFAPVQNELCALRKKSQRHLVAATGGRHLIYIGVGDLWFSRCLWTKFPWPLAIAKMAGADGNWCPMHHRGQHFQEGSFKTIGEKAIGCKHSHKTIFKEQLSWISQLYCSALSPFGNSKLLPKFRVLSH